VIVRNGLKQRDQTPTQSLCRVGRVGLDARNESRHAGPEPLRQKRGLQMGTDAVATRQMQMDGPTHRRARNNHVMGFKRSGRRLRKPLGHPIGEHLKLVGAIDGQHEWCRIDRMMPHRRLRRRAWLGAERRMR